MDPQAAMVNGGGGAFHAASNVPYNLVEIWPYLINASAGAAQCGLGTTPNVNGASRDHDVHVSDPMVLDLRGDLNGRGARKRREDHESAMGVSTSGNGTSENSSKRQKTTRLNENCEFKADSEGNPGKAAEQAAKPAEPPKDFIHVRARRGQATDSHSLAERARREKISERMRILQDLVPGCNKVIGKALVLDEIINYIQSLQRQVEFLSMKLEVVTSRTSPNIEEFRPKDFLPQPFDPSSFAFGPQATREYQHRISSDWLHMQIGGGLERTT